MEKNNKNVIIQSVILVASFILIAVSTSYAFFTANFETTGDSGVSATAADLKVKFTDGALINATNMIPGDVATKSFTVQNTGSQAIKFKIVVKNVVNGFKRPQDLKVEIKEGDSVIKTGESFPTAAGPISDLITIAVGETKSYEITITYVNDPDNNQNEDMEKNVSAQVFIEAAA